ncbi:methyltransferase family protein [Botrimarina colliarenosi]|nr:isoprenylcysteine carboxylmethyltransferase family protein [Botrimarina colliarenosi]
MTALVGLALFAVWVVAEGGIHLGRLYQPERPDRQRAGLTLLQGAYAASLLVGLLDAAVLHWTTLQPASLAVGAVGILLVTSGLVLRITARLQLGRHFSAFVQTSEGHRLVTTGVYSWVRHPAYTGFIGLLLGYPLCFESLASFAIAAGIGLPALVYRIRAEEAALVGWFGDDYRAYQRRTKRLIPGVW